MSQRFRAAVTGLVAALAVVAGCGSSDPEPATVRPTDIVLEGAVREVVDGNGVRVAGADEGDRGVLVVLVQPRVLRVEDRVRVVGEQHTLVVGAIEERFDVDLDDARYRPLEGEHVVVARTVVVLARG